ncbi:MAG: DUF1365 domain-containing protein [Pseudomonadota bacterium]
MNTYESCVYMGDVMHRRNQPKVHEFTYDIYLWFIKLSELETLNSQLSLFKIADSGLHPFRFAQKDYIPSETGDIESRALKKFNELSQCRLAGDVFLLGQVRTFGLYFSPVNFYFLKNAAGHFSHMLAEVSNTPWNQRHYYLVDLSEQRNTEKAFHVSPFNPMDMVYKWRINQPDHELSLQLSCYRGEKHFEAALDMKMQALSNPLLRRLLIKTPSMTIKTVVGIYWQAFKLFLKRIPIYAHPDSGKQKGNNDVA